VLSRIGSFKSMFLLRESDILVRSEDKREVEAVTVADEGVEGDNYPLDTSSLTCECVASSINGVASVARWVFNFLARQVNKFILGLWWEKPWFPIKLQEIKCCCA
jgi:hypothetical protein